MRCNRLGPPQHFVHVPSKESAKCIEVKTHAAPREQKLQQLNPQEHAVHFLERPPSPGKHQLQNLFAALNLYFGNAAAAAYLVVEYAERGGRDVAEAVHFSHVAVTEHCNHVGSNNGEKESPVERKRSP